MKGINKAMIIGTVGRDLEVRHTSGGTAVVNMSVATSESWRDKQTGEKKDNTEWHNVTMFGKLAEIAGQYLTKGSKVYIEGRLQTRKWQDKEGNDRYTTEIVASDMQMLGGRESRGEGKAWGSEHAGSKGGAPADDFEDDVPF